MSGLDDAQLLREYLDFCSMHANPPTFETWKQRRNAHLSRPSFKEQLAELKQSKEQT